jgi:alkylation response protein AidB-like acyl-CoA dehydrogenase
LLKPPRNLGVGQAVVSAGAKVGIRTLAAATILAHGTDWQKEKFLLRILTGEGIREPLARLRSGGLRKPGRDRSRTQRAADARSRGPR